MVSACRLLYRTEILIASYSFQVEDEQSYAVSVTMKIF